MFQTRFVVAILALLYAYCSSAVAVSAKPEAQADLSATTVAPEDDELLDSLVAQELGTKQRLPELDQSTISRLRKMFHASHKLAKDSARDVSILKSLKHFGDKLKNKKKNLFKNQLKQTLKQQDKDKDKQHLPAGGGNPFGANLMAPGGPLAYRHGYYGNDFYYSDGIVRTDYPAGYPESKKRQHKSGGFKLPGRDALNKLLHHKKKDGAEGDKNQPEPPNGHLLHSDARQAGLFSSLTGAGNPFGSNPLLKPNPFNPMGSANPLMGNLLNGLGGGGLAKLPPLPQLPQLPQLMAPRPPPAPRPKTSIIGNDGGPMTLTNDNVVVVNVFSGN